MLQAYVLLKFRKTQEQAVALPEILKEIRNIQGVREAHALFGDIDAIVRVEAQSPQLLTAIVQHIGGIRGVERTDTRIAVP